MPGKVFELCCDELIILKTSTKKANRMKVLCLLNVIEAGNVGDEGVESLLKDFLRLSYCCPPRRGVYHRG